MTEKEQNRANAIAVGGEFFLKELDGITKEFAANPPSAPGDDDKSYSARLLRIWHEHKDMLIERVNTGIADRYLP